MILKYQDLEGAEHELNLSVETRESRASGHPPFDKMRFEEIVLRISRDGKPFKIVFGLDYKEHND